MVEDFFQLWSTSGVELEEGFEKIFGVFGEVLFEFGLAGLKADDLLVRLEGNLADEKAVEKSAEAPDSCFLCFVASGRVHLRSEEFRCAGQLSHRSISSLGRAAEVDDVGFEGFEVDEDVFVLDVAVDEASSVERDD